MARPTEEDTNVGVVGVVVRSCQDAHKEDGGGLTLLCSLTWGLDPVGEAHGGIQVQDGQEGAAGEEEGEDGEGRELVGIAGGVIHG